MDARESRVRELLDEIQREMFEAARARRDEATFKVDGWDEFKEKLVSPGGFLLAHWCGSADCERTIQEETKATIRCLAFDQPEEKGRCVRCDGESARRAHFARAY
jgi:prolyl-tRNA synthetase